MDASVVDYLGPRMLSLRYSKTRRALGKHVNGILREVFFFEPISVYMYPQKVVQELLDRYPNLF